jgi:cell division topological specificity factor
MMNLLDRIFGRRSQSAAVAKNRLQIVLAQERAGRDAPDFLPLLKKEILGVVAKYLDVDDDMIKIQLDKNGDTSILEINVEMDKARIKSKPLERIAT